MLSHEFLSKVLTMILRTKKSNKMFYTDEFNLNVLDHVNCKKLQNFLNLWYQNHLISVINKPTRVTKKTATAIDHIITNCFADANLNTAIYKSDISVVIIFRFVFLSPMMYENKNEVTYLYKNLIKNSMKLTGMKSKVAEIHLNPMKYF